MARNYLIITVSNSQGRNLGCLVTSARTSGFSSIQDDLGESGKGIKYRSLVNFYLIRGLCYCSGDRVSKQDRKDQYLHEIS